MKKTLLVTLMALLLVGCSSNKTTITSKVTDGSTIVAKTEDGLEITKQKIYETLLSSLGSKQVLNEALTLIVEKEITDTEKVNAKVEELLASYKEMLGDDEALLDYIKSNGFETIDQYKEEMIIPTIKQSLLIEKYVDENFDALAEEYGYSYIRYFTMETEAEAIEMIGKIDNKEITFEDAAKQVSETEPEKKLNYSAAASSSIDSSISKLAKQFTTVGMYSVPVTTSDSKYAVIEIMDTDRQANKEAIAASLLTIGDVNSKGQAHYFTTYNFEVFEKGLANDIKAENKDYLK